MHILAGEFVSFINPSVRWNLQAVTGFTHRCLVQLLKSAAPSGQYSSHPGEVPQNHKRTICDLSVADRLALYDHVIGALNENRDTPESSGQDDLYVDWVSKLQKGTRFCFSICSESSC